MRWLTSEDATADALPAVWLVATAARPRDLAERSLLRRAIGRRILARHLGRVEDDVLIGHDARGRPLVARPAGTRLHLSLATRGGIVAVALAKQPVGVDVEAVELAAEAPLALLHPAEATGLAGLDAGQRAERFARVWACKEAYVKALGTGFAHAPETFEALPDEAGGFRIGGMPALPGLGRWRAYGNGGEVAFAAAVFFVREGDQPAS